MKKWNLTGNKEITQSQATIKQQRWYLSPSLSDSKDCDLNFHGNLPLFSPHIFIEPLHSSILSDGRDAKIHNNSFDPSRLSPRREDISRKKCNDRCYGRIAEEHWKRVRA